MRSLTLCLVLACVLSCATQREEPRLDKVSPGQMLFGSPERLLLTGSFVTDLAVDLGSDAPPSVENRFEVRIGPDLAYAVRLRSGDTLEATAPSTLPPGRHDVTVTDAQGHSVTLPEALEVIDRDVHRLVFVTSMRAARPDEWTEPIRLELRDPEGRPAPTSTSRMLRVSSDSTTGRFVQHGRQLEPLEELEVALAPGEWGLDLLYQDSTPGYHTLESSTPGLPSIAQTVAVGRLGPPKAVRFTSLPVWPLTAGAPVALAVEVLDDSGGPASLPATGIQLELSTSSPAGGLAVNEGKPEPEHYHPALSLVLQGSRGRQPLRYLDKRSAKEVWLEAQAVNLDTGNRLESDRVKLEVQPGPTHRLEVLRSSTGGPLPQAGTPERFTLQALDTWGNPTPVEGSVLLDAIPSDPNFYPNEVVLEAGRATFFASFTRAQRVSVVAKDPNMPSVHGASAEFPVRPGPPVRLTVSSVEGSQLAGRPFSLTLEALDRYGNRADTSMSVALSASDVPSGSLSPTTSGSFTGTITLPVTLTAAVDKTLLTLTEDTPESPGRLSATTGNFAVLPGSTQRFVVEDTTSPQTAGQSFPVRIRAVDTYGNLTRDVHELQLGADGVHAHLFSPIALSGFQGQAEVKVTVSQATPGTRLLVSSANAPLKGQQTGLFSVSPGPFTQYAFLPPPSNCVANGTPWTLTVRAVDAWNNTVPTYTGRARLSVAPVGTITPEFTSNFNAGSTMLSVTLANVAGHPSSSCLDLTATDMGDATKSKTLCLNLQTSCP